MRLRSKLWFICVFLHILVSCLVHWNGLVCSDSEHVSPVSLFSPHVHQVRLSASGLFVTEKDHQLVCNRIVFSFLLWFRICSRCQDLSSSSEWEKSLYLHFDGLSVKSCRFRYWKDISFYLKQLKKPRIPTIDRLLYYASSIASRTTTRCFFEILWFQFGLDDPLCIDVCCVVYTMYIPK